MAKTIREHELKTLAPYWDALRTGEKTFEVRRDDRGFQRGDTVALHRMSDDRPSQYDSGPSHDPRYGYKRTLRFTITYILTGGQLGIEPGYVVMGLRKL